MIPASCGLYPLPGLEHQQQMGQKGLVHLLRRVAEGRPRPNTPFEAAWALISPTSLEGSEDVGPRVKATATCTVSPNRSGEGDSLEP